jgi:hypothetical protein
MNSSSIIKWPNCAMEKTVRRAPCGHGTSHLGDVREAPTSDGSFLAGETECVFAITNWDTRIFVITDLEILISMRDS